MRLWITFLLLLPSMAMATATAPDFKRPSPLGLTGREQVWKAEWTMTFKDCFEKYGKNLQGKSNLEDQKNYCDGKFEPSDYKYWLSIFIPLAYKESKYDAEAEGENGKRIPTGLFQMDAEDMQSFQCKDGKGNSARWPKDATQNICCAIQIADTKAGKFNVISNPKPPESGILSAFWQPMREGMGGNGSGVNNVNNTKNHNDIKDGSKKMCSEYEDILNADSKPGISKDYEGTFDGPAKGTK